MSAEHFREHFDQEVRGTIAEGATLTLEVRTIWPIRARSRSCCNPWTEGLTRDERRPADRAAARRRGDFGWS